MSPSDRVHNIYSVAKNGRCGPRVFVPLTVRDVRIVALADSGADISVISTAAFSHLSDRYSVDDKIIFSIKGVGKSSNFSSLGVVYLPVVISGYSAEAFPFHVVDDCHLTVDMILGADFLYTFYLAPSPWHQQLIYAPPGRNPDFLGNPVRFSAPLTLKEKVKIKPQLLSFIQVPKPSCPWKYSCREVVFEPNKELEEKSVVFCRSVEDLSMSDMLTLEVICYAKEPVTLASDTIIGDIWGTEYFVDSVSESSNSISDVLDSFHLEKSSLSPEQTEVVKDMLRTNVGAISLDNDDVGQVNIVAHEIRLLNPDQQPIKIPFRRLTGKIRDGVEEEIRNMYEAGIIEPSNSPWAAQVVPVRKPDGTIRVCVDYRALNKATCKDAYPLPNIEDTLYNLHGIKFFSSLDLLKGYYQIPVAESSKQYTAFATSLGHWQFKRMPFGLCNAPATFQRVMNQVLSSFPLERVMAYLDDILVMSRNFEEHIKTLSAVLGQLSQHGLKVKPNKCQLFRTEVKFLGHIIGSDGLKPLPDNIQAILDFPVPKTVKQIHQFMGMVNYYRRFIPSCSVIAKPLSEIMGGNKLNWTSECQKSFETLRQALIEPPILSYPDFNSEEPLQLYTDASKSGAGACLMQFQDGFERVIAYISTTFNKAELNYSVLDKELAALRWAIKRFKPFLWGRHFILHTDHKPLTYLQGSRLLDGRLARTLEELGEYDFEIRYVPGKLNVFADALSRSLNQVVNLSINLDIYLNGFREQHVKGGGDTLFRCFSLHTFGDESNHSKCRQEVIEELLSHPERYNIELTQPVRRQLRLMRHPGVMPIFECVQAYANLMGITVNLYEEQIGFVRYQPLKSNKHRTPCYVRSYDSVYFSLLIPDGSFNLEDKCGSKIVGEEGKVLYCLVDDMKNDGEISNPDLSLMETNEVVCFNFQSRFLSNTSFVNSVRSSASNCDKLKNKKRVRFRDDLLEEIQNCGDPVLDEKGNDCSRRETFDIDIVTEWQKGSTALRKLTSLFGLFGNDKVKLKSECLRDKKLRNYSRHIQSIFVNDKGLLVKEIIRNGQKIQSYLVPFSVLSNIVIQAHQRNGHIGRDKLQKVVLDYVFHPSLYVVINDVVKSCNHCLEYKSYSSPVSPPILNIRATFPFELVQVDILQLPDSGGKYKYVLNAVDQYSKWFASQPLTSKTTEECSRAFDRILASLPSIPENVMSDNGTEFTGKHFVDILKHYNIRQKFVTPYSPRSNGLVERVNETLINILSGLCSDSKSWVLYLSEAVIIYNNTLHREIGMTPSECLTSNCSKLPIHISEKQFHKSGSSSFKPYPFGSLVGYKRMVRKGASQKLSPRYTGPYTVVKVNHNEKTYVVSPEKDKSIKIRAHHSQLRPWKKAPRYLQDYDLYRSEIAPDNYVQGDCQMMSSPWIPGLNPLMKLPVAAAPAAGVTNYGIHVPVSAVPVNQLEQTFSHSSDISPGVMSAVCSSSNESYSVPDPFEYSSSSNILDFSGFSSLGGGQRVFENFLNCQNNSVHFDTPNGNQSFVSNVDVQEVHTSQFDCSGSVRSNNENSYAESVSSQPSVFSFFESSIESPYIIDNSVVSNDASFVLPESTPQIRSHITRATRRTLFPEVSPSQALDYLNNP